MKQQKFKRGLALLLTVAMTFSSGASNVFAIEGSTPIVTSIVSSEEDTEGGITGGSICENHKDHDEDCGYREAVEAAACGDLDDDGNYLCEPEEDKKATPDEGEKNYVCNHKDGCGYTKAVAGSDCTHECEKCKPGEEEEPVVPEEKPECNCTVKCIAADVDNEVEAMIDTECPVCGVENADLAECRVEEAPVQFAAPRSVSNTITQGLDFTDSGAKPANCFASPISHIHDGEKCFTWDNTTKTLTLNNIEIDVDGGGGIYAIKLPDEVTSTVNWNGINTIKVTSDSSDVLCIESCSGSVILAGANDSASLTITTNKWHALEMLNGTITINKGILTSTGELSGIAARFGITVNGGTVTSTCTSSIWYGIWSDVTINGGTVTAQTGSGKTPFYSEPGGANVPHDPSTAAWDNTTGEACTYKPSGNTAVTGVTLDKTSLSLYSNTSPSSGTLTATVAPANATNKAVTWSSSNTAVATVANGVVTAVGNGTATITVTTTDDSKTATCAVTVSTYTSGGGSSSGGGGGGSGITVTTPPSDKPNIPTSGEIKVEAKVDTKGNAAIDITDQNVADAINQAMADAVKKGSEANGIALVLNADTGNTGVTGINSATVNLPKTVQETIISKQIVNTVVVINSPDIKIDMDLNAVKEINKQAQADVNITAARGNGSGLKGNAKTAIGSRPVFDISVNYGGKQIASFGAGNVAVSIPYELQANEKPGNVQAVYVDANGNVQWLPGSVYNGMSKMLRFSTNHFSTYGVGYRADAPILADITASWAADDITFAVNRGLISGTTATTFSPDAAITRGNLAAALGRLSNADVSIYQVSSFSDVKTAAYYMGYIEWAAKYGIITGTTDGKFLPDQPVTREELAVIMSNYVKAFNFVTPKTYAKRTFADNAKISTSAAAAVKQMQMAGVLAPKAGNIFDPQGIATRAEVSAVLRRFVELTISSDRLQGWTKNDSGQWMFYENGIAATGQKIIGGTTCNFDQSGVMIQQ